jgi:predicted glutamine amidotransferase
VLLWRLCDEDLSMNFASHTTAQDRVAVIATEALTVDEPWRSFQPGELQVFVEGLSGQPNFEIEAIVGCT